MYQKYQRDFAPTVGRLQSKSLRYREAKAVRVDIGYIRRMAEEPLPTKLKPAYLTCQDIQGDPTPQEIRKHGTDAFKCAKPTVNSGSWCAYHEKKYVLSRTGLTKK